MTFEVLLRDRAEAEQALLDISADIALVFEPVRLLEFQHILTIRQPVHAIMAPDHPLAGQDVLRLRDIVQHPVAVPSHAYGVRHLLEIATIKSSLVLNPMVESDSFEFLRHHAVAENIISFQLPIGLPQNDPGIVSRPIDSRDVPPGMLYFGQLKGRTLPVASARFAQQMQETFVRRYECD